MADSFTIENKYVRATIVSLGAWLTCLESKVNGPLLFTRQAVTYPDGSEKIRGGCHVCVPNFGPGGDTGLPQHGYGREVEWQVGDRTADSLRLVLSGGEDGYDTLSHELLYQLAGSGIDMRLSVVNTGSKPLALSPGFHPYFDTQSGHELLVNGTHISEGIALATVVPGSSPELKIGARTYSFTTKNLEQWVLWSDNPARYVCLEPTEAGFSFAEGRASLVGAGESKEWALSIEEVG